MQNNKSIKNVFSKIKELWSDRRGRSIVIIIAYVFFFTAVILTYKPTDQVKKPPIQPVEEIKALYKYKELKDHSYKYKISYAIKEKITEYLIVGNRIDNVYLFTMNGFDYKYESEILYIYKEEVYEIVEDELLLEILNYENKKISQLISDSVLQSKTELFESGSIENIYFNKTGIEISTIEKDNEIKSIKLDFRKYFFLDVEFNGISLIIIDY